MYVWTYVCMYVCMYVEDRVGSNRAKWEGLFLQSFIDSATQPVESRSKRRVDDKVDSPSHPMVGIGTVNGSLVTERNLELLGGKLGGRWGSLFLAGYPRPRGLRCGTGRLRSIRWYEAGTGRRGTVPVLDSTRLSLSFSLNVISRRPCRPHNPSIRQGQRQ